MKALKAVLFLSLEDLGRVVIWFVRLVLRLSRDPEPELSLDPELLEPWVRALESVDPPRHE